MNRIFRARATERERSESSWDRYNLVGFVAKFRTDLFMSQSGGGGTRKGEQRERECEEKSALCLSLTSYCHPQKPQKEQSTSHN